MPDVSIASIIGSGLGLFRVSAQVNVSVRRPVTRRVVCYDFNGCLLFALIKTV